MSADFLAGRPFARTQDGGDDTALAIKHHDGLEAVLIVISVEQTQLLAAMNGVERVVDVQHDPTRHLAERGAVELHHGAPHADQGLRIG